MPIAICALLLSQLGFKPLQAAMLCLVANAASGAFGAIGIPVGVVDTLHLPGNVTAMGVSQTATLTLAIINFYSVLLIFIIDGFKGIKETLPSILVVSVTYTVLQALLTVFNGPELADIIPPLASMLALALFSKSSNLNISLEFKKMLNQNQLNIIKVRKYYMHGAHSLF